MFLRTADSFPGLESGVITSTVVPFETDGKIEVLSSTADAVDGLMSLPLRFGGIGIRGTEGAKA
jgi:hypothetical protein